MTQIHTLHDNKRQSLITNHPLLQFHIRVKQCRFWFHHKNRSNFTSIAPILKLFDVLKSCGFALSNCNGCFRVCGVLLFQKTTNVENTSLQCQNTILRVCRKYANGGFRIRMRYGEICIFMTSYIFFSILTAIDFVLSNLQVQRVKTTILANVALRRGVMPLLFSCYSLRSGSGTRGRVAPLGTVV